MNVFRQLFDRATGCQRTRRVTAQREGPVIHDNRRRNADIDAETCRNLDDMGTAFHQFRGQGAPLGPQHISRLSGMPEAGQIDRIIGQFNPHQITSARQLERIEIVIFMQRQMLRRV